MNTNSHFPRKKALTRPPTSEEIEAALLRIREKPKKRRVRTMKKSVLPSPQPMEPSPIPATWPRAFGEEGRLVVHAILNAFVEREPTEAVGQ